MARRLRSFVCVLLVVLSLTAMMPASYAESYSAYFIKDATVYAGTSTSSETTTVSKGTKVTITAIKGSWAQIQKNGVTGYVKLKYLNLTIRLKGYLNKDTKIYASPSTSSDRVSLSEGTTVYVIGMSGNFFRVQNYSGSITGYVLKSAVTESD